MRTRHLCITFVLCLLLSSSGCQNPNLQSTANCNPNTPFPALTGATRVPAPGTYSIQIPGATTSPYYNNSATAQLPATPGSGGGLNAANGWQPAGAANTNSTIQTGAPTQGSSSRTDNQNSSSNAATGLISVVDRGNAAPRVAQNTNQLNGLSYTNDTNFRSTAVDERRDPTRLPVTDASQVRAPTNFSPTTTVGQFNYPYYNPSPAQAAVPQYPYTSGTNYAPTTQNTVPRSNVVTANSAQPIFAQPSQQIYRGLSTRSPQVLAQSTVYADPAEDPNFQNGWRDRDLTASRNQLNR